MTIMFALIITLTLCFFPALVNSRLFPKPTNPLQRVCMLAGKHLEVTPRVVLWFRHFFFVYVGMSFFCVVVLACLLACWLACLLACLISCFLAFSLSFVFLLCSFLSVVLSLCLGLFMCLFLCFFLPILSFRELQNRRILHPNVGRSCKRDNSHT